MIGGVGVPDADLEEAVQRALQDYLATEGFTEPFRARTGGLVFRRGEVLLRFLRTDRASTHPFQVQVSIGRQHTDIVDWIRISRLTHEGSIAHACWSWELPEQPSLTAALERLREDVLVPHVAAFWRHPGRLGPGVEPPSPRTARVEPHYEPPASERSDQRPDPDPDG